ncbi:serine-rich adhesin for platelets-like [Sycon ciliatum]|uniref:serine-rich adhesin for platelets-like n=1 Tax=Sycon ciliatum TaxID=27933 RepID=UPI0031F61D75
MSKCREHEGLRRTDGYGAFGVAYTRSTNPDGSNGAADDPATSRREASADGNTTSSVHVHTTTSAVSEPTSAVASSVVPTSADSATSSSSSSSKSNTLCSLTAVSATTAAAATSPASPRQQHPSPSGETAHAAATSVHTYPHTGRVLWSRDATTSRKSFPPASSSSSSLFPAPVSRLTKQRTPGLSVAATSAVSKHTAGSSLVDDPSAPTPTRLSDHDDDDGQAGKRGHVDRRKRGVGFVRSTMLSASRIFSRGKGRFKTWSHGERDVATKTDAAGASATSPTRAGGGSRSKERPRQRKGVHYEGALRFYYTSPSGQETAKVVRVQNTTSALDLVPLLLPKFSTCIDERLRSHPGHFYLAIVDRHGEHRLEDDEYPLQISFRSAADAPHRYLLRQTDPVECTAATASAAASCAASAGGAASAAGGGGGGAAGDHLDRLSSATALSTVGSDSTASLPTTAATTTTLVASSAIASNVVTAALTTTSQDSLDTDSTLFTSSGEGVLVPRPSTTTTSAALAQHRQSLSVEREQVAATMSTLSVMPSSLPLSGSPVGHRPLSLSQSSINADSVSDSSSSVDHHAGIMPGDNAGGAYTGTAGTSMHSPSHATSTSTTTPRRLIQTLRRNMRRQSSAGNRRSWHGDEERRRSSASAVNSMRVYTGPGLQEQSASDYKTVFASDDTVARDVIESVLQRLFIYDQSCDDFVLYETIGALEWYHCVSGDVIEYNDGVADWANVAQRFTPRYSRLVAPNEYPQVLMRLWQVDMGSERRMYVHRRNAVPQYRLSSGTPSRSSSPQAQQQPAEDSGRAVTPQLTYVQRFCDSPSKLQFTGVYTDNLCTPFLVTLSCSQPEKNLLVYPLIDKVTSIGQLSTGTSVSIALAGYDLLPLHCTIRCTEVSRNSSSSLNAAKMQDRRDIFSLDAAKEAHVAVNGAPVSGMLVLRDGDLLHLATSHVFVFRDPSQPLSLSNGWKWLPQPDFTSAAGTLSTTTDITSSSMQTASLADDPSLQTSEATSSTSSSRRSARVITTSSSSASSRKSVSMSTVSIGSDPQQQQGGGSTPSDSLTRTMPLVFSGIQQKKMSLCS